MYSSVGERRAKRTSGRTWLLNFDLSNATFQFYDVNDVVFQRQLSLSTEPVVSEWIVNRIHIRYDTT